MANFTPPQPAVLAALRAQLATLQPRAPHGVLPFGDRRVDACLGGGGLALGALHEVAGTGMDAEIAAAPTGFLACLLARIPDPRPLFWIAPSTDLNPAGLLAYGLDPGRLLRVRTRNDDATLAAMEAVLREGTAAGVVAEAGRMGRLASRRLQLACLRHGSIGFVLQRFPHGRPDPRHVRAPEPTASVTSWRLSPAPSHAEFREPGPPCWRVELLHARGGMEGEWIMQAGDKNGPHPVRVVAELADPAPEAIRHRSWG